MIGVRIGLNEYGSNLSCNIELNIERRVDADQVLFDPTIKGALYDLTRELNSIGGTVRERLRESQT